MDWPRKVVYVTLEHLYHEPWSYRPLGKKGVEYIDQNSHTAPTSIYSHLSNDPAFRDLHFTYAQVYYKWRKRNEGLQTNNYEEFEPEGVDVIESEDEKEISDVSRDDKVGKVATKDGWLKLMAGLECLEEEL